MSYSSRYNDVTYTCSLAAELSSCPASIGCLKLFIFSCQYVSVLIREKEEQPHWVVRKEEVEMTEEVIGNGGWGEVRVAKFRSLRVAAKQLNLTSMNTCSIVRCQ